MDKAKRKIINFQVTEDEYRKISRQAKTKGKTLSGHLRDSSIPRENSPADLIRQVAVALVTAPIGSWGHTVLTGTCETGSPADRGVLAAEVATEIVRGINLTIDANYEEGV